MTQPMGEGTSPAALQHTPSQGVTSTRLWLHTMRHSMQVAHPNGIDSSCTAVLVAAPLSEMASVHTLAHANAVAVVAPLAPTGIVLLGSTRCSCCRHLCWCCLVQAFHQALRITVALRCMQLRSSCALERPSCTVAGSMTGSLRQGKTGRTGHDRAAGYGRTGKHQKEPTTGSEGQRGTAGRMRKPLAHKGFACAKACFY